MANSSGTGYCKSFGKRTFNSRQLPTARITLHSAFPLLTFTEKISREGVSTEAVTSASRLNALSLSWLCGIDSTGETVDYSIEPEGAFLKHNR